MGGLLIRSAIQIAGYEQLRWPGHLKNIVFLGTPHHGAPLERAGAWILAHLPRRRPRPVPEAAPACLQAARLFGDDSINATT